MCHRAAGGTDFPRFARAVDVSPIRKDSTPASVDGCPFRSLSSAHHVLKFQDARDLKRFVVALVEAVRDGRAQMFEATKDEMKRWLRARRKDGDPEWSDFLASGPDEWVKNARGPDSAPPPPGA
jgi:hypothetical protein